MSALSDTEAALALAQTYPSSDGQPLAETPLHAMAIILLFQALQDWFQNRPEIYLAIDMFWYWREGDPAARCAPDMMVIPGVGQRHKRSFFSWQENGAIPTVIFEMVSEGNWQEDLFAKHLLYEELGVKEYFLFDPENAYLRPGFQGFQLRGSVYRRIVPEPDGSLVSQELGLLIRAEEAMLRLINRQTGEPILTREEQAREEAQRARQAEQNVKDLEAELARLRALLPPSAGAEPPLP